MSPSVALGLLLGSIYGLLAHLFVGRTWRQLPVYWFAAVLGFFGGFAGAVLTGVEIVRLGTVPLVEATLGSLLGVVVVGWLARPRARPASSILAHEEPGGQPGQRSRPVGR